MKKIVIISCIFFFTLSFSQEKRKAFTLEIAADETHQYKMDVPETPYFVKEKILQIYCGEKLFIECEISNDTISSMKVVEKNENPTKTIEIDFIQNAEDRKNIITMLSVTNPFQKDIIYDAHMYTPRSQDWVKTSIIPVRSKLMAFESWGHSIITLVLDNWRFIEP